MKEMKKIIDYLLNEKIRFEIEHILCDTADKQYYEIVLLSNRLSHRQLKELIDFGFEYRENNFKIEIGDDE